MTQYLLTVAQYNLAYQQMKKIAHALATTQDRHVLAAVRGLAENELATQLPARSVTQLTTMTDAAAGEAVLEELKPLVQPFGELTAKTVKALFKKDKKLKVPALALDYQALCYVAWDDSGSHRRYIIAEQNGTHYALKGVYANETIRGICAICQQHQQVALFTTKVKGKVIDTFTTHSNYICTDAVQCNTHITDTARMHDFFARIMQA